MALTEKQIGQIKRQENICVCDCLGCKTNSCLVCILGDFSPYQNNELCFQGPLEVEGEEVGGIPPKHTYKGADGAYYPCAICGLFGRDRTDVHYVNGGQVCDTEHGPCACGAWHEKGVDR